MLYINTIYERFLHLYVDILSHTLIRNGNSGLFIAYFSNAKNSQTSNTFMALVVFIICSSSVHFLAKWSDPGRHAIFGIFTNYHFT